LIATATGPASSGYEPRRRVSALLLSSLSVAVGVSIGARL
jgi:hypothetical protein